jgi:hypothetical protein
VGYQAARQSQNSQVSIVARIATYRGGDFSAAGFFENRFRAEAPAWERKFEGTYKETLSRNPHIWTSGDRLPDFFSQSFWITISATRSQISLGCPAGRRTTSHWSSGFGLNSLIHHVHGRSSPGY